MFACNRHETKVFMNGMASGCTRMYEKCPHEVGAEIILTSKFLDNSGRSIPFAKAQITSIRPGTVGEFKNNPMIAEMDGYQNGAVWKGQMDVFYGGVKDDYRMFHLKFRISEIDRDAGRRPDQVEEKRPDTL